jgi:DNA-binding response OmpR family regulator
MAEARKKILCIEDDLEAAALIVEELVDQGFEPITAHDGREGFEAILKHRPDLVLCDVSMPVMSGFEVLERLNEIAPKGGRIPFVFLTAMTEREDEMRSRRLGADGYVVKPVDFDTLNAIIHARLAGIAGTPRSVVALARF